MWMWVFILLFMIIAAVAGLLFMIRRFAGLPWMEEHFPGKKSRRVSACAMILVFALSFLGLGMWNTFVIFIHLLVFWLAAELVIHVAGKIRGKAISGNAVGLLGIGGAVLYLAVGVFFACHVVRTEYRIETAKPMGVEQLRIVGFSDSHVGTTFRGEKMAEYVERMNREDADIAVIVGDYVDDDSSYEDMAAACRALADLKTRYGVYYVFGNHDAGYYANEVRGYGKEELCAELEKNGITVLEDEVVPIAGNTYLCGRQDAGHGDRRSIEEYMAELPEDAYVIVLNHQPTDQEAEEAAGAGLVLSGHTHGGQFIPITKVSEWFGINDMTYGHQRKGNTDFIVSSGISNWTFVFKTGCISEYLVVDLAS